MSFSSFHCLILKSNNVIKIQHQKISCYHEETLCDPECSSGADRGCMTGPSDKEHTNTWVMCVSILGCYALMLQLMSLISGSPQIRVVNLSSIFVVFSPVPLCERCPHVTLPCRPCRWVGWRLHFDSRNVAAFSLQDTLGRVWRLISSGSKTGGGCVYALYNATY